MKCPSCHVDISNDHKFCAHCGAEIPLGSAGGSIGMCPHCGGQNDEAAKFCGQCGGVLPSPNTSGAGSGSTGSRLPGTSQRPYASPKTPPIKAQPAAWQSPGESSEPVPKKRRPLINSCLTYLVWNFIISVVMIVIYLIITVIMDPEFLRDIFR